MRGGSGGMRREESERVGCKGGRTQRGKRCEMNWKQALVPRPCRVLVERQCRRGLGRWHRFARCIFLSLRFSATGSGALLSNSAPLPLSLLISCHPSRSVPF